MKSWALKSIRFYQKYLAFLNGPAVCRFEPRCSEYTYQAIAKYGILRGTGLGILRLAKCQPLSKPGLDPLI